VVAQLEGLTDRDAALKLKGSEVAVPRETLPKPDDGSYYWSDLIGLAVVNTGGESLGAVKEIFSNGAQDVIDAVDGEAGEVKRLIPWTVVQSVDLKARRIEVEWEKDW
jgi:16S rRNA processing protein RimM